jgi:hypothetical protein
MNQVYCNFSGGVSFIGGRTHLGKERNTVWAVVAKHRDNPLWLAITLTYR